MAGEKRDFFEHDDTPFSSYHFVIIPYCTADFHWGNNEKDYKLNVYKAKEGSESVEVIERALEEIRANKLYNLNTCTLTGTGNLFLNNNLLIQNTILNDRPSYYFFLRLQRDDKFKTVEFSNCDNNLTFFNRGMFSMIDRVRDAFTKQV